MGGAGSKNTKELISVSDREEIYSQIKEICDLCSKKEGNYHSDIHLSIFTKTMYEPIQKVMNDRPKLFKDNTQLLYQLNKNRDILVEYIKKINLSKDKKIYQCLSCIFGAFLGDATGAYCEFLKSSRYNHDKCFKGNPMFGDDPGQVTDDSEMAMSLAFGIMDNPKKKELDSNYLYYYYGTWYKSDPKDIGNTTREALRYFDFDENIPEKNKFKEIKPYIEESNSGSLANGFLMRISPLVVWIYYRNEKLVNEAFKTENNTIDKNSPIVKLYFLIKEQAKFDNYCTHPNEETFSASAAFILLALGAIIGLKSHEIINKIKELFNNYPFDQKEDITIQSKVNHYINLYSEEQFDYWNHFTDNYEEQVTRKIGWYVHAFKMTLYYLMHFDENVKKFGEKNVYKGIMEEICDYGGDTDTNAAIVGTVIGPLIGYNNFGEEFDLMIKLLPKNREIYSPCFMALFIDYLVKTNKEDKEDFGIRNKFTEMYLKLIYTDIDGKDLCK